MSAIATTTLKNDYMGAMPLVLFAAAANLAMNGRSTEVIRHVAAVEFAEFFL